MPFYSSQRIFLDAASLTVLEVNGKKHPLFLASNLLFHRLKIGDLLNDIR
jgi:hypothetical protein